MRSIDKHGLLLKANTEFCCCY